MKTEIINVEGMSCSHCVNAIAKAVGGLKGVQDVMVSLENKNVTVNFSEAEIDVEQIKSEIEDQGYDVL